MLAGMLQISTPNVWVRPINGDEAIGWEARYEARAADGRLLSSAEGECRRLEEDRKRNGEVVRKWEHRAEHAIRSMAQTRAQSKALASALRWVVELGGFSGTPAEEMTGGDEEPMLTCPACGKNTVRDNRAAKKADPEGKDRWPSFGCRNNACTGGNNGRSWATWDDDYYEPRVDRQNQAKQRVLDIVADREDAWRAYYEPDAPGYTADEEHLLHSIHETGDQRQMAGFLWNRLIDAFDRHTGQADLPDAEREYDWAIIVRAADNALAQAAEDEPDIILEDQAIAIAEEQVMDEAADADGGYSDYA
jgi:hypothetical protein